MLQKRLELLPSLQNRRREAHLYPPRGPVVRKPTLRTAPEVRRLSAGASTPSGGTPPRSPTDPPRRRRLSPSSPELPAAALLESEA